MEDMQTETLKQESNQQQNPNNNFENEEAQHDFETLARSWLSTLPTDTSLNPNDVENWIQSNSSSLPDHIKSMPQSDVFQLFNSFLKDAKSFNEVLIIFSFLLIDLKLGILTFIKSKLKNYSVVYQFRCMITIRLL